MSRGQASAASPSRKLEITYIDGGLLRPNPWNPNKMNAFMYAKAQGSIDQNGFFDPILVRELGYSSFQIIDGEHRWRAGTDRGMTEFPCINLGLVDDIVAKRLTIIANELRGQAEPAKLTDLLRDIASAGDPAELLASIPFTPETLSGFLGSPLPTMPPPPGPATPASAPSTPPGPAGHWVERTYRMPTDAAEVLDEAIAKARITAGTDLEPWQALELIAADFMGS